MSNKEDKVTKEMRIQHENKTKFDNIINKTPMLKKLRDQSQGLTYRGDITSDVPSEQYKNNYDKIKWGTDKPKANFKIKINGVYQDRDNEQ
jgi:hypothetical protein